MTNLNVLGYTPKETLDNIAMLIKMNPAARTIVEVGSFAGRSAVCIANAMNDDAILHCFDRFKTDFVPTGPYADGCDNRPLAGKTYNINEEFDSNTFGYNNIVKHIAECPNECDWDETPIDILFLDTDHKNPNDWDILEYFMPYLHKGSVLIGDDHLVDVFPDVHANVALLETIYDTNAVFYNNRKDLWSITL